MCGISGFAGHGELNDLYKMNAALRHRGPDAEGVWYDTDSSVFLGHTRLSIIDLQYGAQPMATMDGQLVVVFNGEIYNHRELRLELEGKGRFFKTDHSDTEVLLHGYREWGAEITNKLNGMWAFAIYDKAKHTLFLSRDRFGKKPLFYSWQNGTFAFASELDSLIKHPLIESSVSKMSLKKYFAYGYIPAPNSLYSFIYKLPGGHNLVFNVNESKFRIDKYWDFVIEPMNEIPENPEKQWGEKLRELIRKSVKRRLMSDVPLGIFLSGGIDSSLITSFAAGALDCGMLKTFSIGFKEESFDESQYAKRVADLYNTDHFSETLSIEKSDRILSEMISRLDEPMGDSSLLPTYLLCKVTKRNVSVALGGDGGDELFAGYDPFFALHLAEIYQKIVPSPVHRAILMVASHFPVAHKNMSLDFRIKRTLRGLSYPKLLWNSVWLGPLEPTDLEQLFREPVDPEEVYSEAIQNWDTCPQKNIVDRTLQFYTKLYLQDDILAKIDRASMMNSLEVRTPYLDIELVDFVRRIPWQYKFRYGTTKYILKKSLTQVLPREIIYRSKKGFGIPVGKWFRDSILRIYPRYFSRMLDKTFVKSTIREHIEGKHDHRAFLWNLWILQKNESAVDQL